MATETLPDGTFLMEQTLEHNRLNISRQSAAVARFISALAANPRLRNPLFRASVARNEAGSIDLFCIGAETAP